MLLEDLLSPDGSKIDDGGARIDLDGTHYYYNAKSYSTNTPREIIHALYRLDSPHASAAFEALKPVRKEIQDELYAEVMKIREAYEVLAHAACMRAQTKMNTAITQITEQHSDRDNQNS